MFLVLTYPLIVRNVVFAMRFAPLRTHDQSTPRNPPPPPSIWPTVVAVALVALAGLYLTLEWL